MNTCQVNKTFFKNKTFKGVFPCDQLPNASKFRMPYGLIVNTDPASKPGEHWISIYVNENNHAEIFDSFGRPPSNEFIVSFVEKYTESSCYSIVRVQHEDSEKCGQFSIGFLKARMRGYSTEEYLSLFTQDKLIQNDFVIELFNKNCAAYKNVSKS